jgi:hypothetical protein
VKGGKCLEFCIAVSKSKRRPMPEKERAIEEVDIYKSLSISIYIEREKEIYNYIDINTQILL